MLKNFITILLLSLATTSYGQEIANVDKKFYFSAGYGLLLNVATGPTRDITIRPNSSVNIIYGGLGFRYNLVDFSTEFSMGISTMPILSFGLENNHGNGIFTGNLPLYVEINKGLGSTYSTEADDGFFMGVGVDMDVVPIIIFRDEPYKGSNRVWVLPSMEIGGRWYKDFVPKEIKLQVGIGKMQDIGFTDRFDRTSYRPFSFKVTYNTLLKY